MIVRTALALLGSILGVGIFGSDAFAQQYPNRTITFIVSFPAGGLSDIAARVVASDMQARLGQTIVVENRVGGSGIIGASHVARAQPDGYTLLVNAGADVTNLHYMPVPYDVLNDFTPIGMIADGPPLILIVNPNVPYKTVGDLVAGARANPGKLSFGSSGVGASPSIAIAQFNAMSKAAVVDVPYRGVGQAAVAVVGGEIQGAFAFQSNAKPLADEGKVRALASTNAQRSESWPDLPTMIEQGFPGFVHAGFVGLAAPAKTPASIISLLNKHLNDTVNSAAFRQRFVPLGMPPRANNTPEDFAEFLRRQVAHQAELAKLGK
jgi:tripartite-type tricarboxylate transporter receptor subunit TctC